MVHCSLTGGLVDDRPHLVPRQERAVLDFLRSNLRADETSQHATHQESTNCYP
jgi:hypothetical protein